jgi:hypothetical protein
MGSERLPDATFMLSGSDTTFILDEPVEPQHTLKIAVFDEASSENFQFERIGGAIAGAVGVLPQMQWRVQSVPLLCSADFPRNAIALHGTGSTVVGYGFGRLTSRFHRNWAEHCVIDEERCSELG